MSCRHGHEAMLRLALPGLTRSAPDVREPGHSDERWATRLKHYWTRAENLTLLECYYMSKPRKRGYMQRMWKLWKL